MRQLTRLSRLSKLVFSNRAHIQGFYIVRELGVVSGSYCECGGGYSDMKNSVANAMGGQITQARQHVYASMQKAVEKTLKEAEKRGANAVVNLREQITTAWVKKLPFIPMWWLPPSTYYFTHVSGTAVIIRQHQSARSNHRSKARSKPWMMLKMDETGSRTYSVLGAPPTETIGTSTRRHRRGPITNKFQFNI
eukprot:TRINITY_DN5800_c0_g1_i1.p1 TRINITY_DN5800_c0_g1~~TRINITY_DN5800_c0_g1_i1.p1  ORF type:complete len:193 (+),score=27.34 TRINITY_DN5800_c0_g1_i1:301-879(+)